MKTKKKALALVLCAVLLVAVSVTATVAFLTSKDSVKNTFTIGKVSITLDEAQVNEYGEKVAPETRVKTNEYTLLPSHTYVKDPTVHFAAGSEASYIFAVVYDGLTAIEDDTTIAAQIVANGWTKYDAAGVAGSVYYKKVDANETNSAIDYKLFDSFTIKDTTSDLSGYEEATIEIKAYAIQSEGLATAAEAFAQLTLD